jgi:hypothetical protein
LLKGQKRPEMADFPPWSPDPHPNAIFVTVETHETEKRATELPIVSMKTWLNIELPDNITAKPLRDGKILVKVKNEEIVDGAIARNSNFFGKFLMKITKKDEMNTSKGTNFDRALLTESLANIAKDLENKGVSNIERIDTTKSGENIKSPNGLHVLTFTSRKLPKNILVGYIRYNVRPNYPRPLRCFKCLLYGHTQMKCQSEDEYCRQCAKKKHDGTTCEGPLSCRNCPTNQGKLHSSLDRICPVFQREEAICRMKVDEQISWSEARQRFQNSVKNAEETYSKKAIQHAEETAK